MMLPDAVVMDCPRCGERLTLPVTGENGEVFADARGDKHECKPQRARKRLEPTGGQCYPV